MLGEILAVMMQEPPVPSPRETPDFAPSPALYVLVALAVMGVIAWKYKAWFEFVFIACLTFAGFIIGFLATPPYANIGLGFMVSIAALLISTAVAVLLRLIQRARRKTASA